MYSLKRTIVLIALVSMSGLALGAAGNDVPKSVVSFADLDLSQPAAAAVLLDRIMTAAHAVCETHVQSTLDTWTEYQRCVQQAVLRAVADVNVPTLVALRPTKQPR